MIFGTDACDFPDADDIPHEVALGIKQASGGLIPHTCACETEPELNYYLYNLLVLEVCKWVWTDSQGKHICVTTVYFT